MNSSKRSFVEIITIGDEILIGQIVDTNSAWMAKELNKIGLRVTQITSISDSKEVIISSLILATQRADVVLITGGLGPTKDDITKMALLEYFGGELEVHEEQLSEVQKLFKSFGKEVSDINVKQAEVPTTCSVLVNLRGTAPGMWFEKEDTVFVSMPGVPYEMKWLMENRVLPKLKTKLDLPSIKHRTFLTQGVGESILSEWISDWEDALPSHIKLAYLPSPGLVRLRLSAVGKKPTILEDELNALGDSLYAIIGKHIYGEGQISLPEVIQALFIRKNLSLSVAESCTGGNISHLITSIAGSSAYYKGGAVPYTEKLKTELFGVSPETIITYGVVSEEVARELAEGARNVFNSDYAISITGIAGPSGGTDNLPLGSIWIGIAGPEATHAKLFRFSTDRQRNITMASLSALNWLRRKVLEIN